MSGNDENARTDVGKPEEKPSRPVFSRVLPGIALLASLCLFLVIATDFGASSQPPDLTNCTRLEIRYYPSTLKYFLPRSELMSVLSTPERTDLESLKALGVSDREQIRAFARDVARGFYAGRLRGRPAYGTPVQIACYRGDERLMAFTKMADMIVVEGGRKFSYPKGLPDLRIVEPVEIRLFRLRFECAEHLSWLHTAGSPARRHLHRDLFHRDAKTYPAPDEWCDAVVRAWRDQSTVDPRDAAKRLWSERWMASQFTCQSASARGLERPYAEPNSAETEPISLCSHYAMNPDCKPASPSDTVLLFETKAGWNQHGGPELFTFANHDPRGGCVLLNDGTVKFIRTEEELYQLRWK